MHYKIGNGIVIKTENAAKPHKQVSAFLVGRLRALASVESSFDYGCGKLRYRDAILARSNSLTVVDSEIQIDRDQILYGREISIRELVRSSNRVRALNAEEFRKLNERFDRAFCINVLSVIPIFSERQRVLRNIHSKLKTGGTCLFVVQYRNSDFSRMAKMKNARRWRDGFLIDSLRGYSFYGLISPDRLTKMVVSAGFDIVGSELNEGSVYLTAARH